MVTSSNRVGWPIFGTLFNSSLVPFLINMYAVVRTPKRRQVCEKCDAIRATGDIRIKRTMTIGTGPLISGTPQRDTKKLQTNAARKQILGFTSKIYRSKFVFRPYR